MMARVLLALAFALAACTYGEGPDRRTDFVLTFAPGSDTADPAQLDRIAAAAKLLADFDVTVDGYVGPATLPEAAQIEGRLRAQAVADGLLARGVARGRIHLRYRRAFGADPAEEGRRVEIRLAP